MVVGVGGGGQLCDFHRGRSSEKYMCAQFFAPFFYDFILFFANVLNIVLNLNNIVKVFSGILLYNHIIKIMRKGASL